MTIISRLITLGILLSWQMFTVVHAQQSLYCPSSVTSEVECRCGNNVRMLTCITLVYNDGRPCGSKTCQPCTCVPGEGQGPAPGWPQVRVDPDPPKPQAPPATVYEYFRYGHVQLVPRDQVNSGPAPGRGRQPVSSRTNQWVFGKVRVEVDSFREENGLPLTTVNEVVLRITSPVSDEITAHFWDQEHQTWSTRWPAYQEAVPTTAAGYKITKVHIRNKYLILVGPHVDIYIDEILPNVSVTISADATDSRSSFSADPVPIFTGPKIQSNTPDPFAQQTPAFTVKGVRLPFRFRDACPNRSAGCPTHSNPRMRLPLRGR